jgi:hypothetical protein
MANTRQKRQVKRKGKKPLSKRISNLRKKITKKLKYKKNNCGCTKKNSLMKLFKLLKLQKGGG